MSNSTLSDAPSVSLSMRWDYGMVIISYLVSVQAAYTSVQILQMRISVWLIAVAALCLSVSGIWSMHFIGMAAMTVDADVTYDLGWTIASIFFAYFPMFAAFWTLDFAMVRKARNALEKSGGGGGDAGLISSSTEELKQLAPAVDNNNTATNGDGSNNSNNNNNNNNSSNTEHPEMQIDDTRDISVNAHITAMKRAPHGFILLGGCMIALGACLMHYLGMHAVHIEGAVRTIDVGVVIASCFIALFAGTAALYFAFILPLTREYTVPTALVAGAAVSGMHYVGMYGIRYEYPQGSEKAMHHSHTGGDSSIEPFVIYIIFASSAVSSVSLALSSYFYRESLRKAADEAEERAGLIIAGKFDELGALSTNTDESRMDPIMMRLKVSNAKLGEQMQKLRSFLPPSLLAQFEAQEGNQTSGDDDDGDDEGDLSLKMSLHARPNQAHDGLAPSASQSFSTFRGHGSRRTAAGGDDMMGSRISHSSAGTNATHTTTMTSNKASSTNKARQQYNLSLEQRNVGVLSLNCHGFNQLLSDSAPQFMSMYSHYIDGLCGVAKSQRGVLDIVHGDRVLMTFNAAMKNASYGRSCATAAVHIARDVGAPGISGCVAIGVASGPARVGNMGSRQMMKYNVCGPVVGHAVKAQQYAFEQHGGSGVHICGMVTEEMKMAVRTRSLDIVQWKHMSAPVIVSEIVSIIASGVSDEWMYELENNSGGDPFSRINKAFFTVFDMLRRGEEVVTSVATEGLYQNTVKTSSAGEANNQNTLDAVIAPSLCCNCTTSAKRTLGEILAYTEAAIAAIERRRGKDK